VVLIIKYSTIQEAIEIANSTRYGLGASVFGPDQRLAVKVARRLECGMVAVNDFGVFYVSTIGQCNRSFTFMQLISFPAKVCFTSYNLSLTDLISAKTYRLVVQRRVATADLVRPHLHSHSYLTWLC